MRCTDRGRSRERKNHPAWPLGTAELAAAHHHPQLHHDAFPRSGHGELAGRVLGQRAIRHALRALQLLERHQRRRNGISRGRRPGRRLLDEISHRL